MIKAVFFDIDGTLRSFTTQEVPQSAVSAAGRARQNGVKLYIATGRNYKSVLLSGVTEVIDFDGFLTLNGQLCLDESGSVTRSLFMDAQDISALVSFSDRRDAPLVFYEQNDWFCSKEDSVVRAGFRSVRLPSPPVADCSRAIGSDILQVSVTQPQEDDAALQALLPHSTIVRWHPTFADIIPASGGKAAAMRYALEHHSIDISDCMAMGDGGNDCDMIRAAGVGVAMGNAEHYVKACADYVTTHIDDDGVFNALTHFGII